MTKKVFNTDSEFDFGFSFSDDLTDTVSQKEMEAMKAQTKAETLYNMIMPLLNNLKKNPEKSTIVWPDRQKKIDEFIKKMESVLNS